MDQLYKGSGPESNEWSCGSSQFLANYGERPFLMPIAVNCRIGDLESTEMALLDTGAEWSIISSELLDLLEIDLTHPLEVIPLETRFGKYTGNLHRIKISLLAEENHGKDLSIEGSVLFCEDWNGPTVLGFRGFLERIRFAVDPGEKPYQQLFYFGTID